LQSKTTHASRITEAPEAASRRRRSEDGAVSTTGNSHGFTDIPVKGENRMKTSSMRKLVLGTAIAASMGIGYAIGAQPHMTETITLLQSARAELAAATPNKGGHRERALGLIDQAIGEVRAGIAFAAGG
jgi:hypothetical protein